MSVQARPQEYARAIYELAIETWVQQLGSVQQAMAADASLRATLHDASLAVSTRLSQLKLALPGELNEPVRKLLGTLLEAGQIDQLGEILSELDRLVHREPERLLARVGSAVPLTEAEKEALRTRLVERFGPELEFEFEVDPSLLGGIRLRVGDRVIDGSVAGKLAAMRDRLAA